MTISPISLGNTFTNSSGTTVLGGLSSGLNTQSVINGIVAAQSAQITPLQDQITVNNNQASALNTLQQLLADIQTAASLLANPQSPDPTTNLWAANTSNVTSNTTQPASNFLTATAAPGTANGTYTISDITSIASATTQQSAAFSDTNTPIVVASGASSGQFNAGTITITGPGGSGNVTFHAGDTLSNVVADFNAASGSTGLTAAAKESGGIYTLTFTNTSTGAPVPFNMTYASDVTSDPDGVLSALTANAFTVGATSDGVVVASGATSGQFNAGTITINGPAGSGSVTLTAGDSLSQVATDFNNANGSTGLTATVVGSAGAYSLAFTNTATGAPVSFSPSDPSFGLTADASNVFSAQTTGTYTVAASSDAVVVASGATTGYLNAGTFTIQGPAGTGTVTLTAGESLSAVAAALTASGTGLTATVAGTSGAYTLAFTNTATGNPISVSLTDPPAVVTNNPYITSDPDGVLSEQGTASYTLDISDTPVVVASGATGDQFTAGTLDITGPGGSGVVTLKAGDTLSNVAADFNAASNSTGISASVLQTSPGQYTLVFTSTTTGAATAFDLSTDTTVTGGTGVLSNTITASGLPNDGVTAGTDANFELNGTAVNRPTNTISDLISGVTFNLLQNTNADASASFTIQVAPDTNSIEQGITGFATAYNNFLTFYATQTQLNSSGTPASAAVLYSDTTLRSIYDSLSNEASSIVQGLSSDVPNSLSSIGISFATTPASGSTPAVDNTLSVDSSTLLSALQSNFSAVENVFGSNVTSSSQDVALYQSPTVAGVTNFTLNVNQSPSTTPVVVASGAGLGQFNAGTIAVTGPSGTADVTLNASDSLDDIVNDFNLVSGSTGLTAAATEVTDASGNGTGAWTLTFTNTSVSPATSYNFDLTNPADVTPVSGNVLAEQTTPTYTFYANTAEYTDPTTNSPVLVGLTSTSLGSDGVSLTASTGALAGMDLIYGSTAAASGISVSLSQGVADQINNAITGILQSNTGLIAEDQTAITTKTTTLNTQITSITKQVTTTRQQLLTQFAALETAINAANSSLDLLNAEQNAGSASSG